MQDEFDVQYLLLPLLDAYFDDVRSEDAVPSVAGQNSRIDFALPDEKIALEVKMTRPNLRDSEIGDELSADIIRYQKLPLPSLAFEHSSHLAWLTPVPSSGFDRASFDRRGQLTISLRVHNFARPWGGIIQWLGPGRVGVSRF
jgi:hypothetical protein